MKRNSKAGKSSACQAEARRVLGFYLTRFYSLVSKLEILFSDLHKIRALSSDPSFPRCFLWRLLLPHCIYLHTNYSVQLDTFLKTTDKGIKADDKGTQKGNIKCNIYLSPEFSHTYAGHDLMETRGSGSGCLQLFISRHGRGLSEAQGRRSRIPII